MKQGAVTVLRWIGVLPCALAVAAVSYLFIYYSNYFFSDEGSWNMAYLVPIECSFVSGGLYMLCGVEIAPAYKKQVAIALLVIVGIIACIAFFAAILEKAWFEIFKFIVTLIGVVIGYLIATEVKKEKTPGNVPEGADTTQAV